MSRTVSPGSLLRSFSDITDSGSWLNIDVSFHKVRVGIDVGKWGPANTDGISIFQSQKVQLANCRIASGDDKR